MKLIIKYIPRDSDKMICLLTGRYQQADHFLSFYKKQSNDYNIAVIQPEDLEWYPLPNGPEDQKEAVKGIQIALPKLHKTIKNIRNHYKIQKNKISIAGFSAGGVMALELNAHSRKSFNSVVVHSGAILRIKKFPKSKNDTPILLLHNKFDTCFDWNERFIPMCNCLNKNKYTYSTIIDEYGDHEINEVNIENAMNFIKMHNPI